VPSGIWFPTFRMIVIPKLSQQEETFFLGTLDPEEESTTMFWNIRNRSSKDTTSHLNRLESSSNTALRNAHPMKRLILRVFWFQCLLSHCRLHSRQWNKAKSNEWYQMKSYQLTNSM
jgi:hypothetical protein